MTYRLSRDRVGIRTPNLLIRSEVLYPVELHSQKTVETGGKDTNSPPTSKCRRKILSLAPKISGPWLSEAPLEAPIHVP